MEIGPAARVNYVGLRAALAAVARGFCVPSAQVGRYCGRRVAMLHCAGELFACRRCYGLAYASQHEGLRHRGLVKAQKIRMRLGGSLDILEEFPDRPRGMHRRTYKRLRDAHDLAAARPMAALTHFVDRLQRRVQALEMLEVSGSFAPRK